MSDLVRPQVAPVGNGEEPCWDRAIRMLQVRQGLSENEEDVVAIEEIIADGQARDAYGRNLYGVPLQPFNGRDALVDLYQELLDGLAYGVQATTEGDLEQSRTLSETVEIMEVVDSIIDALIRVRKLIDKESQT